MVESVLVAILISMFLISMSAVFEMRNLNKENERLRAALKRANKNTATYKALAYDTKAGSEGE